MRLARHPSVTSIEVERNGGPSQSVLHASHSGHRRGRRLADPAASRSGEAAG
jgi:hypothetical protein